MGSGGRAAAPRVVFAPRCRTRGRGGSSGEMQEPRVVEGRAPPRAVGCGGDPRGPGRRDHRGMRLARADAHGARLRRPGVDGAGRSGPAPGSLRRCGSRSPRRRAARWRSRPGAVAAGSGGTRARSYRAFRRGAAAPADRRAVGETQRAVRSVCERFRLARGDRGVDTRTSRQAVRMALGYARPDARAPGSGR